jgi:8-amino-7-oxononanoate synthase
MNERGTPTRSTAILPGAWAEWADDRTEAIARAGQWRTVRSFDASGPVGRLDDGSPDGRRVISFASNDYLGLSSHPTTAAAAVEAIGRWGTGSGAARLVVGSRPVHHELEHALADWRGTEAALVLPTGFAANLAALTTFGDARTRIVSDELNHASIVDGCRLARAEVTVYPHADTDRLEVELERAERDGIERTIVVTDTVFSMDGDVAPIESILESCRAHGSMLVVDEAHAVLGPSLADHDTDGVEIVQVGTLSKALGSLGGFIAGSTRHIDLIVNLARPFIFTTALTPADTAAALAALGIVRSAEGDELRARLRGHIDRLAPGHPSPILPLVVGDEADTLALAAALLEREILVPAIRPPTVPPGTSRLRIALSAAHTDAQIEQLAVALGDLVGTTSLASGPLGAAGP